jgi:Lon protease-like protein
MLRLDADDQTCRTLKTWKDVANALGQTYPESAIEVYHEEMPLLAPYEFRRPWLVANRWCELLPIQPELKQRLLLDNPCLNWWVSDILKAHRWSFTVKSR